MSETSNSSSAFARGTVIITGTGSSAPKKILTNADLEKLVETSDEWIVSRTGIRERHIAAPDEHCSDFAANAARAAMEQANVQPHEIDLILIGTVSGDMKFPATACIVQQKIGAINATCMDISAACSGFLYALEIGRQMLLGGDYKTALIIGAEKLSSFVNWKDRNTCVLFGDGAGAAILKQASGDTSKGLMKTYTGSDGQYVNILNVPGGGTSFPITAENAHENLDTLKMAGKEVYKQAVNAMTQAAIKVLEHAKVDLSEIKCIIPHQANIRIVEAISDRLKVPLDRFMINLDRYGNTGAAAIAIALDEAHRTGRFQRGDKVLLLVFGGGLTWAGTLIEW